ncbi:cytochrome c oxidase assembly factor CtaG [Paenibacillus sp. GCM10023252]|uniref:cytochrome c oxidase assembly factor CtaG n=1 Tax=Paenibacillus sp. GCM10023252 TaxID=3252649 RepID=UPI00362125E0
MLGLQYFSFVELWSPMFFFAMSAVVILYYYLIGPWRLKTDSTAAPATRGQQTIFVVSAILFYLVQGGPLELLGHLMFTFHMVNMSIAYLIVPPLVLLAVPGFLWKQLFSKAYWNKLNWLMHPIMTLVLFNMLFSIYHIPAVHDYVMIHYGIHSLYYLVLLLTSFMMWWQVICPVPEWNRLTDMKKMAYVFANGVLLTPACALIIFAAEPMYATYSNPQIWVQAMGYCLSGDPSRLLESFSGPSFFNLLGAADDQQTGGIVMKLVQEFTYGCVLALIFKQWYRREHREDDLPNAEPV